MVQGINAFESNKESLIQKLKAAGITQDELQTARSQGMDSFKQLLSSHGIQPPTPPQGHSGNDEFMKKLEAAGITKEEFHTAFAQGPDSVTKLLKSHGIEPPNRSERGERPEAGHDDFIQKLKAAGITKEEFEAARAQGRDAVEKLLKSHGIEPPNRSEHGERPEKAGNDDFIQKLKSAGITKEEFEAAHSQGFEAMKKLLESHNIKPE